MLMRRRRIKALPVVDRHRRILGIVTLADFMRHANIDMHGSLRAKLRPSFSEGQERESLEQRDEAVDPVCGMTVEVASARHVVEHGGGRYYFCCLGCKRAFEKEPEKYAAQVFAR